MGISVNIRIKGMSYFSAAVDEDAKTMTVLSPAQGPLPRKFLLQSDIKFLDLE